MMRGVEVFLIIPKRGWCSEFSHKKKGGGVLEKRYHFTGGIFNL